ncbi:glycosyltransferase [Amphiplicatus metriothermophilus]|uniref:Hopene-associated glycosyltransferase HpnB n=1 Tax=Amphiplicatus metriothermophilus TaxID=1519374 RepID=A0A239PUZ6_9PROT|nr:glycosyltransferase [Amphiplicatus metriothermophilus]MBB5519518.1 hopene-associated glycosyltransferase HpnB [Amphiplicatus metriothermophilus]SNT74085.1 hopene-associated glycosyltransferase HpnB [Amphiplicatus metriothermophilus]
MLTFLAFLALGAWLYLAFGHGDFWRAEARLDAPPPREPETWPEAVAVIPARDEAAVIARTLASHQASDYPGRFSLVVVDDESADETGALARAAAAEGPRAVDVIDAPPLAPGWTGKLSALAAGVARAKELAPDARYFLFTDADIEHAPATLRRLVAKAETENLALVSLMARLDARGAWGPLLIPAFVYFFQKLYPFARVNNPESTVAAAAGGCMLVRREAYDAAGGAEAIRDQLIDDCALARRIKREGAGAPRRIWLGLASDEVVSLRDNRALSSVWRMVARTAFAQLDHSWLLLAGTVAGMAIVYLVPPLAALSALWAGATPAVGYGLAAWAVMAATYRPTATLYGLSFWKTLLLPLAAFFYMLMTISSAERYARGEGGSWKGRSYS